MLHSPEVSPILIIDDNPTAQRSIQMAAGRIGISLEDVHMASTTEEARNLLLVQRTFIPRTIISEIIMPDEETLKLLQQIRADQSREDSHLKDAYLIVATTVADSEVQEACRNMGIRYLLKPVGEDQLVSAIRDR